MEAKRGGDEWLLKALCATSLVLIGKLIDGGFSGNVERACGRAAARSRATDTHLPACTTIRDRQAGVSNTTGDDFALHCHRRENQYRMHDSAAVIIALIVINS